MFSYTHKKNYKIETQVYKKQIPSSYLKIISISCNFWSKVVVSPRLPLSEVLMITNHD